MVQALPSGASYGGPSDIISQIAGAVGLPAWVPLDIARFESGLNPRSVGDHGTSFGLFQLHRGGLAPSRLTNDQLLDPFTNASVAIPAMKAAYTQGVSQGLSGEGLLDYVAFNSGWPGHLGTGWTEKNRPDYVSGLHNVYVSHLDEVSSSPGNGKTGGGRVQEPGKLQDVYQQQASTSAPTAVFRAISSKEQFESFSAWKAKQGRLSLTALNPFSYIFDQGTPLVVRGIIILLALAICIIAVLRMIEPAAEAAMGGGGAGHVQSDFSQ